ncbi:LOB domain-containing protein 15 isoform X2 [Malania oleifera]|nr:LOB domain-containing protein 15 isoform X2 [Malania oleifera]
MISDLVEEAEVGGKKSIKREVLDIATSSSTCEQALMGRRVVQLMGSAVPPNSATSSLSSSLLNNITPCAACKLLRRRCAEECPFSPYFSPHEPHKFAAVHKVFGASNVSKMLMEVPENLRADAANSLVYEANVRLRDPVYGCMGAISALQQQVQTLQAELSTVRAAVLRYKYREVAAAAAIVSVAAPPPPLPPTPPPALSSSSSSNDLSSYTLLQPSSTTTGYSSISGDDVPYFG